MRSIRWLMALWGLLGWASLLGTATAAEAPPGPRSLDLSWQAPAECPTQANVEREILRLLAQSKHRETLQVQIAIQRQSSGSYRLLLTLLAPVTGTRTLSHPSCASAARAAALIVAMAIDADAVALSETSDATLGVTPSAATSGVTAVAPNPAAPLESEPSSGTTPEPRPVGQPLPKTSAASTARASSVDLPPVVPASGRWRIQFGLGVHLESTFTPTVAPGAVLIASAELSWLRISVAVAAVPGSTFRVPSGAPAIGEVGARFFVGWGELAVCGGRFQQAFNLALCGGFREHWIRAAGRGVDEVLTPVVTAAALTVGPVLSVRLVGPLGIEANVQAVVPLRRPRFVVEDIETLIFQPARVGVGGALSLTLGF